MGIFLYGDGLSRKGGVNQNRNPFFAEGRGREGFSIYIPKLNKIFERKIAITFEEFKRRCSVFVTI